VKATFAAKTVAAALLATAAAFPAHAGLFNHSRPKAQATAQVDDATIQAIERAIDEQRLLDAGRLLDAAFLTGSKDPRLGLLAGELSLAHSRYADALAQFTLVESAPQTKAKALEDEGISLSMLGRSGEAIAKLQAAVDEDPTAWRAWNALGSEYDNRRDWTRAEAAYDHAMVNSDGAAAVLNNRGFSRLLQNRLADATADFVAALEKKPDLTAARTNLRLAMALKGEYDRATAAGANDDQPSLLNNAGFAAMMRGDYAKAQDLFNQAIAAKGRYYEVASENLTLARSLAEEQKSGPK
jgi:Flp pilus assembly protein TadD